MFVSRSIPRLLAILAIALVSVRSEAGLILDPIAWGLAPGDTFRLILPTLGTTAATSTSISTYDTFVNGQYLNLITYQGSALSWQAVGETSSSAARYDATRYSSQADLTKIFNLNGERVSNGNFWGMHDALIDWTIDASGNLQQFGELTYVYTGFTYQGEPVNTLDTSNQVVYSYLGQTTDYTASVWDDQSSQFVEVQATLGVGYGRTGAAGNAWAEYDRETNLNTAYHMFAMSSLVTVVASSPVPEIDPAGIGSVVALLSGAVALLERRRPRSA